METAIDRLCERFPLERRVMALPMGAIKAYRSLIDHWCDARSPTATKALSRVDREALLAIDAVIDQSGQLGCYPFSALPTGIQVHLGESVVHAMCAIDALAVSRVSGQSCRIAASCALCGKRLTFGTQANGGLCEEAEHEAAILWADEVRGHHGTNACCDTLCPGIRFICRSCAEAEGEREEVYTLAQAAVVANAFFGFQARLRNMEIG
ncbi:hypothetical protein HF563_16010 [Acidithiobacillus ferridurans]|uniref:organomercurial lyase n=1 Tax=Acidithiobacillus ferridurans TaxID=1232575 RepID=UPI001C07BC18|nr:organomercurial lyase [Acidithiobacillus ferridurans]MBU2720833.1 hypothetical protein [Acidithiobacillus ferridurans]MBU2732586.1 hypothetical protein [Acidithiobacillus ferridurans]